MTDELLGLAFAAGLVAALNPCGFAMLPAYLTFVVAGDDTGRPAAVGRALAATAAMTLGFLAVFGVFGALTISVASTVQQYLPVVTVLVGIALIGVGGWLLAGREIRIPPPTALTPGTRWAPTARLGSMFGYGVGYAIASLSCTVGPFLAVTGGAARTGSLTGVAAVYASYAAGFALIVGTLAVAAAFTSSALAIRLRRALPAVHRIGGALVIVVGLYVTYYGIYELRLFNGGGDPNDGVVVAAGRLQGALAGWVHQTGGWPWLVVLAVLLAAALGWAWRRRAR
ncbi:cytochrome c biogenesis CcdA family protein [soil metagenome]